MPETLRNMLRAGVALVAAAVAAALVASASAGSAESGGGILNTPAPAATASLPAGFQDSPVITGLSNPTVVRFSPDGRIFVAEDRGLIKEYDSLSDTTPTIVADLRTEVDAYWDRGLLGMVLDPSFPTKPYIYVIYTYDAPPGGTAPTWNDACPTPPGPTTDGCVVQGRISRLTLSGNTATSEQVLVQGWCQQFPSHSIGDLQFGPDGYLYASGGEGANFNAIDYGQWGGSLSGTPTVANPCGDPPGAAGTALSPPNAEGGALRSQSVRRAAGEPVTLSGSLLRVDPATGAGAPTNPLSSSPDANARRIVAYGFRNPFRFTFRPGTNEIWVTDVGWNTWEEIDRVVDPTGGPANYGWPCYEGVNPQPSYQSAGLTMCNSLYSGTGGSQTGTFGDQTVYTSVDTAGAGLKEVTKYTAVAGNVTKLSGYISGLGQTTGTQNIEAVIYADSNGTPGALLGVSSPVTVSAGRAWGWTDFTFASPVAVQAGSIWLGYIASDSGDLIQMRYLDQAGSVRWNTNPGGYAAGPSNPFGTATSSNKHYSLYATYTSGSSTPAAVAPYFTYNHSSSVVAGDGCPTGGSSATGDLFYTGNTYPAAYTNALFFMDHTRGCIWTMPAGANGLPDPNQVAIFETGAASPVDIEQGPDGNIYYVDFDGGTVREITFTGANQPPTAVASADVTSGPVPLTVNFDGSGSSDPNGDPITYSWDLNGDGVFGDSTAQKPSYTYSTAGTYDVRLRVTDSNGASTTSAPIIIDAGNQPPVPVIDTPASTLTWRVGTVINFSGHATDTEDGTEPSSRLSWAIILHHCFDPTNCHTHLIQTFTGVASGSFTAPDHGYPCWLEIQLTAMDSTGTSATTSIRLDPQTVNLTIASSPSGAQLSFDATTAVAPFTQTVVIGSSNTVSAPTAQTIGNGPYTFSSWSDGGAATHTIVAPASATTYTAKYRRAKH